MAESHQEQQTECHHLILTNHYFHTQNPSVKNGETNSLNSLQSETLDFTRFRHSLFVEADECSTLGSVLLRYVTKQMQRISPQKSLGVH